MVVVIFVMLDSHCAKPRRGAKGLERRKATLDGGLRVAVRREALHVNLRHRQLLGVWAHVSVL